MKQLKPIPFPDDEFRKVEREIIKVFRKRVYLPLINDFNVSSSTVKNSMSGLLEAIRTGRITFNRGVFSGRLNATISKEIKALGGKFNRKSGTWRLSTDKLPIEVKNAVSASFSKFSEKIRAIDRKLAAISPESFSQEFNLQKIFDATIFKTEKELAKSLKSIVVRPSLTDKQRAQLAEDWTNNIRLSIKDFATTEIKQLRADMEKSVLAGNRYGSAVGAIMKSYGVTERKAKFLARQETKLVTVKLKEMRYVDAGITKYKWKSVSGTPLHPVRPSHKALNDRSARGELFDFRKPPEVEGGRHANPGEDYNCRCVAIPCIVSG